MRVLQLGNGAGFSQKMLTEVKVSGVGGWQHFHGYPALQTGLVGLKDCSHAALPNLFDNLVLS